MSALPPWWSAAESCKAGEKEWAAAVAYAAANKKLQVRTLGNSVKEMDDCVSAAAARGGFVLERSEGDANFWRKRSTPACDAGIAAWLGVARSAAEKNEHSIVLPTYPHDDERMRCMHQAAEEAGWVRRWKTGWSVAYKND